MGPAVATALVGSGSEGACVSATEGTGVVVGMRLGACVTGASVTGASVTGAALGTGVLTTAGAAVEGTGVGTATGAAVTGAGVGACRPIVE